VFARVEKEVAKRGSLHHLNTNNNSSNSRSNKIAGFELPLLGI
jgi:hypothetical protein